MNIPKEDHEAEKLANYLRFSEISFSHIANERNSSIKHGAKLKRMGVSAGFPDYMIIVKTSHGFCTVFIELKRQRKRLKNGTLGASPSKVSEEQQSWIHKLNLCEMTEAKICYGADEAIEYIEEIKSI